MAKSHLKGLKLTHKVGEGAVIHTKDLIEVVLGSVEVDIDSLTWLPTGKVVGLYITGLPNFDPTKRYELNAKKPLPLTSDITIGIAPSDIRNLRWGVKNYCEKATLTYQAPPQYLILRDNLEVKTKIS